MPIRIDGTGYIGTANNIYTDANGNVGIGTASAGVRLDITDNGNPTQGQLRLNSSGAYGTRMTFVSTSTNGKTYQIGSNFVDGVGEFAIYDATSSANRLNINSSGYVTMPNQPGFSAYHAGNINYNSITNPIPFETVRRNTGNHYNPSTYTFTAPVTGKYFFSAFVHFMGEASYNYQFLSFATNGTGGTIEWMRQSDRAGDYGVFGGSTIFHLAANDTVYMNYISSGVDSGYLRGGAQFNVFEGQLIG